MVRRWACVAMLGLTACPGVEALPSCRHVPLTEIIDLRTEFRQPQPPLGLISAPMTVRVAAPVTACAGDDVRATVRLFDAANEEITVEWTTAVRSAGGSSHGMTAGSCASRRGCLTRCSASAVATSCSAGPRRAPSLSFR